MNVHIGDEDFCVNVSDMSEPPGVHPELTSYSEVMFDKFGIISHLDKLFSASDEESSIEGLGTNQAAGIIEKSPEEISEAHSDKEMRINPKQKIRHNIKKTDKK